MRAMRRRPSLLALGVLALALLVALAAVLVAGPREGSRVADRGPGSPDDPVAAQPTPVPAASQAAPSTAANGARERGSPSRQARSREPSGRRGATVRPTRARWPAADAKPGYEALVDRQSPRPRQRFTPCSLVTRAEASAMLKTTMPEPIEAPQGPTCIYRPESSSRSLVTIAVQSLRHAQIVRQIGKASKIDIAGRIGYCGILGQPMLYVPLSGTRVLSIGAPCPVARRFAAKAVPGLVG
jgi:hypothetical protein